MICPRCRRAAPVLLSLEAGMSIMGRLGSVSVLHGFECRSCCGAAGLSAPRGTSAPARARQR